LGWMKFGGKGDGVQDGDINSRNIESLAVPNIQAGVGLRRQFVGKEDPARSNLRAARPVVSGALWHGKRTNRLMSKATSPLTLASLREILQLEGLGLCSCM
jgi:hypothetical protein